MPTIQFEVQLSHPVQWTLNQTFNVNVECLSYYVNLIRAGVGGFLESLTDEELQMLFTIRVVMTYKEITREYVRDVSDLNIDTYLVLMLERAHRMIDEIDLPVEARVDEVV